MTKQSQYCIVEAIKSHCPKCGFHLVLLQDIKIRQRMPMFFVCFDCSKIYEVGRGEVQHDQDYQKRTEIAFAKSGDQ